MWFRFVPAFDDYVCHVSVLVTGRITWVLVLGILSQAVSAQVLVANPAVGQERIERSVARSFFYMRMRNWPNGDLVKLVVLPDSHPLHVKFCKRELGVLPHRLRRTWDRAVFAGLGQSPEQVDSIQAMRERIANTPGSIGYLPEDGIDESVQALEIE